MYPQIFSHIFPQIINFFIYKYYPQIFSPKYSHVSIHNYSRIFILRNCLPSHRYSCLPTHMFLPLPFLRFVFLVRTQIALAIIVHGHFSIMYNCTYSIFSGSNLGLEPPRSAENTHCLKWLKFHFCEPENSRPFAEFLVPIGRIIFLGL